jgi:excisionase family DNA binding protein
MSSNIKIQRICQYCGRYFTAYKTITRTCSADCAKRLYKQKVKTKKIEESNQETQLLKMKPVEELKKKEFLTITETCTLLSISRWTIWRAMKRGDLIAGRIGRRTLIRRSDLDSLFEIISQPEPEPEPQFEIAAFYTLTEVQNKYGISEKALYQLVKRMNIPKIKKGSFVYVPKMIMDDLFS